MEARTVLTDSLSIFGHFAVELFIGIPFDGLDSIKRTGTDAAAAALTQFLDDVSYVVFINDGVRAAFFRAAMTVAAQVFIDDRFARRMLFHLAGTAAAAHAYVFNGSAKTRRFVTLEVSQADEDVGIHDGPADFSRFDIFAVFDGDFDFIRAPKAVANDDLTACRHRVVAIKVGTVHVFQGMFTAARIKGVAVRQEGAAAQFFNDVGNGFDILRTQRGQTAQFPEMEFDGNEFAFKVDISDAGLLTELLQLL
ncbi:hypothetical protein HMPREF3201_02059 [Megasphaera sp. MJR8396C]|nr:hypothetical protein HMPREF3201_02059 [Megasphaera sp. MJR8396C]